MIRSGQKVGRLTTVKVVGRAKDGQYLWRCRCSCGQLTIVVAGNLSTGHTRSCGCLAREATGNRRRIHGAAGTREFWIWVAIRQRCYNKNNHAYSNYGGRGITVCARWRKSFKNFFADVGKRPHPSLTLDRINNDQGYSPKNWRWATRAQQSQNRRPSSQWHRKSH